MKLLDLNGPCRGLGQLLLRRRQGPVQRDHQRALTQDHSHRFGYVARSLLLEYASSLGDLLRHGEFRLIHRVRSWCLRPSDAIDREKKTDVVEHPEVFDHAGLLANEPPDSAGLPFI